MNARWAGALLILLALTIGAFVFDDHPDLTTLIKFNDHPSTEEYAR